MNEKHNLPTPGYGLLQNGETIEEGDLMLSDNSEEWAGLVGWEIGVKYDPQFFVPIRRLQTQNVLSKKESS